MFKILLVKFNIYTEKDLLYIDIIFSFIPNIHIHMYCINNLDIIDVIFRITIYILFYIILIFYLYNSLYGILYLYNYLFTLCIYL